MEQHLFVLLLFTGFVPLVQSRYILIQVAKNWSDAQVYCREKHIDLAIIRNNDDEIRLQNETLKQQFASSAWIGLHMEENNWFWSMGNESVGNMTLWRIMQPDNWQGEEACAALYGAEWSDRPCSDQLTSICFDNTKTGNQRYIFVSAPQTWSEAQAYCRTYHTDLASSKDATENSVVAGLGSGLTWFGLFRDSWKWADRSTFLNLGWIAGQPDNSQGNENCVYATNGQVGDAQCSDLKPFFCSMVPNVTQLMRVKVRSSQDVNDPAIKLALLEQIMQVIKDHGLAENTTSRWKEQPDSKVFYKEKENNGTETKGPYNCVLN